MTLGPIYHSNRASCPNCGGPITLTEQKPGQIDKPQRPPQAGDIVICTGCAVVLEFMSSMGVRIMTDEDVNRYSPQFRLQIADARRTVLERRGRARKH